MAGFGVSAVGQAQVASGNLPTQQSQGALPSGFTIPVDFSKPNTWVWVLFGGSVAYLLGAYVVLRGYRVPL
jgi:hypothetical protein